MQIGFLGLGAMGSGMAVSLLAAGHQLSGWNRSPDRAQALAGRGLHVAATAGGVCTEADAVFAMLANDEATLAAMHSGGVLDALPADCVLVNCASVSVDCTRALAAAVRARGAAYVAAPVLGRPDVAAAGALNLIVAGDDAAVTRVQPALDAIGKQTWRVGVLPERATIVKIAANFMLGAAIEAMAEACALTRAHGVEAADFLGIVTQTVFAAPAYQSYGRLIAEQRYRPAGFATPLGLKDVNLALTAAGASGVRLPLGELLREALEAAIEQGGADQDWSVLAEVAARRVGL